MGIHVITGIGYDSNIYVITGKTPTIVDTGTGFHSNTVLHLIQSYTELAGIRQILLTHEHFDHVGGVPDILKATKNAAKVLASENAVEKLSAGKSTFAEMLGGTMPKLTVDVPAHGGERLRIGDDSFEILATPGHSVGGLCFFGEKNKILFSGDTVFANGGFGRYDFPGGDLETLRRSIERLADLDVQYLYAGHGPIIEQHGKDHIIQALQNIRSVG